jgi:hypothetical protein
MLPDNFRPTFFGDRRKYAKRIFAGTPDLFR